MGLDAQKVDKHIYMQHLEDQNYLRVSRLDTVYLAQALSKATNCRTVRIDGHWDPRPWGSSWLIKQIGVLPAYIFESEESDEFLTRLIHVIFSAVTASCVPLQRFEISTGLGLGTIPLNPGMLQFPELYVDRTSTLTTLRLYLATPTVENTTKWARDLVRFVMHFPQPEVLGLTFDTCLEAQYLKPLHEAIHLDSLRVLEIASVDAGEEELAHLLISLGPILNRVLLRTIRFPTRGSWISFVRSIRDNLSVTYMDLTNCNVNDTHFLSLRGHPKIIFQEGRENLDNLVENMVLKSMVLPDLLNHHLIL